MIKESMGLSYLLKLGYSVRIQVDTVGARVTVMYD